MAKIAWGKKVSKDFKAKVIAICDMLGCDPSHLMSAMAFETGESFSPTIQNGKSGATGLIQFMPNTAKGLGTSIDKLLAMTAEEQLDVVERHLKPFKNRMKSLSDVYMTILLPSAVGKPEAKALFVSPAKAYVQNKGLDVNKDGIVTKGEAASKVQLKLNRGLSTTFCG
jgi:Transglycosylase SLT domain